MVDAMLAYRRHRPDQDETIDWIAAEFAELTEMVLVEGQTERFSGNKHRSNVPAVPVAPRDYDALDVAEQVEPRDEMVASSKDGT